MSNPIHVHQYAVVDKGELQPTISQMQDNYSYASHIKVCYLLYFLWVVQHNWNVSEQKWASNYYY